MFKKIREALWKRSETMDLDEVMTDTKKHSSIDEKLDKLGNKIDFFKSTMRSQDDTILISLFDALEDHHEFTTGLQVIITTLNQRLLDLSKEVRTIRLIALKNTIKEGVDIEQTSTKS